MIDIDGRFEYSKIVTIKNNIIKGLQILGTPVSAMLTLNRLKDGWIELINTQGIVLQKVQVKTQSLSLNLSAYSTGIYFIRYTNAKGTEVHKIMKQ
jgi:hypothetical protein